MKLDAPDRAGDADPLWYKDGVVYQLHVRSFFDHNGDGIGDFAGLHEKLDYLEDLGVSALWLLPFYPSPMRDGGYDIADYVGVHPEYGTLRDVRALVREAHRRGLRLITELVCNHTSDRHPWFERARSAPRGSAARDWYVWSDTTDRYRGARVIFSDAESSNWSWDPLARAHYWHRFFTHQPDLNFANPAVRRAILRVLDFWLELGIDGVRLDAIPYLFERDGTNCENLPETHEFIREMRRHIDERFADRMLVAEANQWPEDAATYFGDGDECHMCFHFPLMPRLYLSLRTEDRFPIVDILAQTPAIPASAQWALFLRNHDELTLEMVTDEERDYMHRVYTRDPKARVNLGIRRRLAPLLENNRRRIELMNGLLFSLPGTPFIYYGDEIGMGDNIYLGDRDGVRTPMQWSGDRNAGFSRASRQRLFLPVNVDPEYHYEAVNVELQRASPYSLLSWMKRLIALRRRHPVFGRGGFELLHPRNRKVLAFVRADAHERILVIANLSRFVQAAELDLRAFCGSTPVELFGGVRLPRVTEEPYVLTLGPHSFYWLTVEPEPRAAAVTAERSPLARHTRGWSGSPTNAARRELEELLPAHLRTRRWFSGRGRTVRGVRIRDLVPLRDRDDLIHLALVDVGYVDGEPDTYLLPLARASGETYHRPSDRDIDATIAALPDGDILYDGVAHPSLAPQLLAAIMRRRRFPGQAGEIVGHPAAALASFGAVTADAGSGLAHLERRNSSLVLGERLILKLFRRLDPGPNPELEIGRALTERVRFPNVRPTLGSIDYRAAAGEPVTIAVLQAYIPSEGDAWTSLVGGIASALAQPEETAEAGLAAPLELLELLGRRTAELHAALASIDEPAFKPEPFTAHYRRAIYQAMHAQGTRTLDLLRDRLEQLPEPLAQHAREVLGMAAALEARFRDVLDPEIVVDRIRIHGDLDLRQILLTAGEVTFIDFEGDPARSLSERRLKRSALRDAVGMLRSIAEAIEAAAQRASEGVSAAVTSARIASLTARARERFISPYLEQAGDAGFVPRGQTQLPALLRAFELEKTLRQLEWDLTSDDPVRVRLAFRGLLEILG